MYLDCSICLSVKMKNNQSFDSLVCLKLVWNNPAKPIPSTPSLQKGKLKGISENSYNGVLQRLKLYTDSMQHHLKTLQLQHIITDE